MRLFNLVASSRTAFVEGQTSTAKHKEMHMLDATSKTPAADLSWEVGIKSKLLQLLTEINMD